MRAGKGIHVDVLGMERHGIGLEPAGLVATRIDAA